MNSTDVRVHVSKSVSFHNAAVHFKTWTSTHDLKSTHTLFCLFVFDLDIFLNFYFKINQVRLMIMPGPLQAVPLKSNAQR